MPCGCQCSAVIAGEAGDAEVMTDRRVTHSYDGERLVGSWFAQNVTLEDGFVWDAYLLYGPDRNLERCTKHADLVRRDHYCNKGPKLRDKLAPLLKP